MPILLIVNTDKDNEILKKFLSDSKSDDVKVKVIDLSEPEDSESEEDGSEPVEKKDKKEEPVDDEEDTGEDTESEEPVDNEPVNNEELNVEEEINTEKDILTGLIKYFNDNKPIKVFKDLSETTNYINVDEIDITGELVKFKFDDYTYRFPFSKLSENNQPIIKVDMIINEKEIKNIELILSEKNDFNYNIVIGRLLTEQIK